MKSSGAGVIPPTGPASFVYKFLRHVSGPGVAGSIEMNTNSSMANPSIFEYAVPSGRVFQPSRFNIEIVDGGIRYDRFAGIAAALANGCLFRVLDVDDSLLLDFCDGTTLKQTSNFIPLAGVDTIMEPAAGDDGLPVRFSIFRAGTNMRLIEGQKIQWTNRDDLSSISLFRIMVQGVFL